MKTRERERNTRGTREDTKGNDFCFGSRALSLRKRVAEGRVRAGMPKHSPKRALTLALRAIPLPVGERLGRDFAALSLWCSVLVVFVVPSALAQQNRIANWPTYGGDAQRSGWQTTEASISVD